MVKQNVPKPGCKLRQFQDLHPQAILLSDHSEGLQNLTKRCSLKFEGEVFLFGDSLSRLWEIDMGVLDAVGRSLKRRIRAGSMAAWMILGVRETSKHPAALR